MVKTNFGLKIKIVGFADDSQPGFVNCIFTDALGKEHEIFDKIPVVTDEHLDEASEYPREGLVSCVILDHNPDRNNPDLVKINIAEPLHISTINEETIILVSRRQLADADRWTGGRWVS